MAAVSNVEYFNGASLTATNDIEGGGTKLKFNKSDDLTTTTTPVTVPTSAATNYSFVKYLGVYVTTSAATTLSNLSIALGGALTTGFGLFSSAIASGSYVQAGTSTAAMTDNATTDVTASGTTPTIVGVSGTRLSTTPFVYDATGGSANVTNQLVGKLCATVFGVSNAYTGGGGSVNTAATNTLIVAYDEA